jgi:hypothetical protein
VIIGFGVAAVPLAAVGALVTTPICSAVAHADSVAYLTNVTVAPGYNFPNAEAALAYGNAICETVGMGATYADIMEGAQRDFASSDEFQHSYLVTQAVGELCQAQIWRLRQSADGYRLVSAP